MGASERVELLLSDFQVCRSSALEAQPDLQEPQIIDRRQNGVYFEEMSPRSLDTLSSAEFWDDSCSFTAHKQSDGKLELFKVGFSNMVQQLNESRTHVAHLECEIKSLKEEKLKQEYQNHTCVMRLRDRITDLEQKAELDLEELKRRQNQAYLNGQYKAQEDQLHKLEAEKISHQEKIHELEQAQQGFYNRVLSNEDTAEAAKKQQLHEEKLQLLEKNKQELDLLRTQIAEAADFEIQMIRKTRDLAVSEREKAQSALQESRTENEKLIERYNELKFASLRSSSTEDECILKRESKIQKLQEEMYHELCQAKIENEVLSKKLESSTQNLLKVESELTKAVVDLKVNLEAANASLRQYHAEEELLNEALQSACKGKH